MIFRAAALAVAALPLEEAIVCCTRKSMLLSAVLGGAMGAAYAVATGEPIASRAAAGAVGGVVVTGATSAIQRATAPDADGTREARALAASSPFASPAEVAAAAGIRGPFTPAPGWRVAAGLIGP